MPELLKPDICVIGAGSGGLSVAAAAAAFGASVVLVEKGKMGGDCLNTGCVPSKSLIAAGKRARAIAEAGAFGVSAPAAASRFRQGSPARARRHRRDRAERFEGAVQRPGGAGDRRRGALQESSNRAGRRRHRDQGAALRHCHRVDAVAAGDPGARDDPAPHQRDGVRSHHPAGASHRDRRGSRSASSWRRPFAGSAPR